MFDNITDFFDEYVKKDLLLQNHDNNIKQENTDEENNIIENNITQIYNIINTNIEENDPIKDHQQYDNDQYIQQDDTQQDDTRQLDTKKNINYQENIDFISELLIMNNKI